VVATNVDLSWLVRPIMPLSTVAETLSGMAAISSRVNLSAEKVKEMGTASSKIGANIEPRSVRLGADLGSTAVCRVLRLGILYF
jgi:hypothetical protein